MADDYLDRRLAFDRGIDSVTHLRPDDIRGLPLRQEGPPSELGGRPQLEALIDQPTLDQVLEDALRPQLENRELMVPSRFQSVLEGLHTALSRKLEEETSGEGTSLEPEDRRILQRAVRLLKSEQDLRSLVQMYRSVLYQG